MTRFENKNGCGEEGAYSTGKDEAMHVDLYATDSDQGLRERPAEDAEPTFRPRGSEEDLLGKSVCWDVTMEAEQARERGVSAYQPLFRFARCRNHFSP